MSKAEKFIHDYTRNCSNYTGVINKKTCEGYYVPWLTPDQARRAVEIAREEAVEKACEWLEPVLKNYAGYYAGIDTLEDFRKYMERE